MKPVERSARQTNVDPAQEVGIVVTVDLQRPCERSHGQREKQRDDDDDEGGREDEVAERDGDAVGERSRDGEHRKPGHRSASPSPDHDGRAGKAVLAPSTDGTSGSNDSEDEERSHADEQEKNERHQDEQRTPLVVRQAGQDSWQFEPDEEDGNALKHQGDVLPKVHALDTTRVPRIRVLSIRDDECCDHHRKNP